jgi:DNA-nicking Smr family endonuclease
MSKPTNKVYGLAGLALVRTALHAARDEAARPAQVERQRRALDRFAHDLFVRSVGPVVPLRKPGAPRPARPRPVPLPRQRERDEALALEQSMSDRCDPEWLLDTDDHLSFRRRGVGADVVRKLRRGVWAIQAQVDLHGLRRDAARAHLVAFLHEAARSGWRCVRIIHGKGNGSPGRESVLKAKVKGWLVQNDVVLAFAQARAVDGGHGALLALLKVKQRAADVNLRRGCASSPQY